MASYEQWRPQQSADAWPLPMSFGQEHPLDDNCRPHLGHENLRAGFSLCYAPAKGCSYVFRLGLFSRADSALVYS
jgi:hypothetical protein